MKYTFASLVLFFVCSSMLAQSKLHNGPMLTLAYFSHALIQPGAKIGAQFELKTWEKELSRKEQVKSHSLFVHPQLGVYTQVGDHISYLFNTDIGLQQKKEGRKSYMAYAIGLGYLLEDQLISQTFSLGDGAVKGKERDTGRYFLPSLNVEYGRKMNARMSWYSKLSFATKMSAEREDSFALFVELGLKFNLKN